jgi:hypothetical protein
MTESQQLMALSAAQLRAGRAESAAALANAARELGEPEADVLLAIAAGARGKAWPAEPSDFDATCLALHLPLSESRAMLARALLHTGRLAGNSASKPE